MPRVFTGVLRNGVLNEFVFTVPTEGQDVGIIILHRFLVLWTSVQRTYGIMLCLLCAVCLCAVSDVQKKWLSGFL